jgi:hypothetical protein
MLGPRQQREAAVFLPWLLAVIDVAARSREGRGRGETKGGAQIDSHDFDAGKLIKGKKRHILVDMQGLLLRYHRQCSRPRRHDLGGGKGLAGTFWFRLERLDSAVVIGE